MAKRFTTGEQILDQVMQAQELRARAVKDGPLLYYRLESKLDERRKLFKVLTTRFSIAGAADFSSNDILSFSSSGLLRKAWDEEMAKYPGVQIGSGGSRLLDGSHPYTEDLEQRIASFHKAEGAMILNSGCECNSSIFSTIPTKEDVILYDELVHASIHDGMAASKCRNQFRFAHNDLDSFRENLERLGDNFQDLKDCKSNIFISLEAIYSMDGDITPLAEMVEIAKAVFPHGNANFIIDEAHATGLLGDQGKGLVGMLGLENEISIRVHTFSKALASYGGLSISSESNRTPLLTRLGVILSNKSVRDYLVNFSRGFMYTAAPALSTLAAIKVAYDLLESPEIVVVC
jgi:8-amino-7-oxononanoate synthase